MGKETKGMVFDLTGLTPNKNKAPVLKNTLEKPKGFNKTEILQAKLYSRWGDTEGPGFSFPKHHGKLVKAHNIISPANRRAMLRTAKLLK